MLEQALVVSYPYGRGVGEAPAPKHRREHLSFEVSIDGAAPPVTVTDWFLGDAAWLLEEGMEIAVWVDPQTGDVLGVNHEKLAGQLAAARPEYDARVRSRRPSARHAGSRTYSASSGRAAARVRALLAKRRHSS